MQYVFKKENVNPKLMDSFVLDGWSNNYRSDWSCVFLRLGVLQNHLGEILMVGRADYVRDIAISIVLAMYRSQRIQNIYGPRSNRNCCCIGGRIHSNGQLV